MYILETLETKETFKIGEYLSAELSGNIIIFSKDGKEIGRTEAEDTKIFKNRKLKGVVREKAQKGYKISIVRFADLHRHSGYSLLDGICKIEDLANLTEYVGALTDHGNMFGFLEYYKAMKKVGKQPIIGFEAYSETIDREKKGNHLILLAQNKTGYENLIKLTSIAYENFHIKPHVSYEMLQKYSEGIICLSACIGGEVPQAIIKGNYNKAKQIVQKYKSIFGNNYYLEIQRHGIGIEEDKANEGLLKLSKEFNIKVVATTDSHYSYKEDEEIHEMLLALQTGRTLSDPKRMRFKGSGYHIHTPDEMDEKFKDIPEALDNTLEIAEKCSNFELKLGKIHLPKFDIPKEYKNTKDYFEHLVYEGFKDRFQGKEEFNNPVYKNRLEHEIKIIEQMGYPAYFLIVWDFINYAKQNKIMVGPGRGSAVGSLAAYCLNITDLDPIPYGLLFERFLNPERVTMPDIDVDFCYERREEVINYVKKKYGEKAVSRIVTFGTFAARGAIRDIARINDYPYSLGDKIARTIPPKPGITIEKALEENPELKEMYDSERDVKKIVDIAKKIEGIPRHSSTHACGLVVAPGPVNNYLPEFLSVDRNHKDKMDRTAQVTMTEVEELGLLKMDFLGLKTMTTIGEAIKSINRNTKENIKYEDIPHDDPYVYREISKGNSQAVFQLESPGMRTFMKELYPDVDKKIKSLEKKHKVKGFKNPTGKGDKKAFIFEMKKLGQELFERLIAGIALYRPGPLDYIPNYLKGMENPDKIEYLTPKLEPILKSTYGTIVYQEQVMQIVQSLAGYSLGRADLVRRAMGKKKVKVMEEEKEYFINGRLNKDGTIDVPGCIRNGISKEIAEEIWEQMVDFAKYAFNKSHAAAYALLGAITGWLKCYYPVDFMAETMNTFINKSEELTLYLSVTNDMGIKTLPPSVNLSKEKFLSNGKDIRFGLRGIRNMGVTSELIVKERNERGKFNGYQDFVLRMAKYQKIDKRVVEGLIYSGALDEFEGTRKAKIEILQLILDEASIEREEYQSGQVTIFDISPKLSYIKKISIPKTKEFDKRYKLELEKKYAGLYITEHPLDCYQQYFKKENIVDIGYLITDTGKDEELDEEERENLNGKKVKIAGIIRDKKTFYTKKDAKPLYVFQLEGKTGSIKAVMFCDKIEKMGEKVLDGNIVIIDGYLKNDNFGLQMIVNDIEDITMLTQNNKKEQILAINILNKEQLKMFTNKILNNNLYEGNIPVFIKVNGENFKSDKKITLNMASLSVLNNIFGENYRIIYK